jgi:hypothetical protein
MKSLPPTDDWECHWPPKTNHCTCEGHSASAATAEASDGDGASERHEFKNDWETTLVQEVSSKHSNEVGPISTPNLIGFILLDL